MHFWQVDAAKYQRRGDAGQYEPDRKWKEQIVAWREALNIPRDWRPFDLLNMQIHGCRMTPRVQAILNMVVASKLEGFYTTDRRTIQKAIQDTIVDISQNPIRRAFTPNHGVQHCLCTSASLIHLGLQRCILPAELMLWQGHNSSKLKYPAGSEAMSSRQARNLAGEGMFLPSLGVVVWCLLLTGSLGQSQ